MEDVRRESNREGVNKLSIWDFLGKSTPSPRLQVASIDNERQFGEALFRNLALNENRVRNETLAADPTATRELFSASFIQYLFDLLDADRSERRTARLLLALAASKGAHGSVGVLERSTMLYTDVIIVPPSDEPTWARDPLRRGTFAAFLSRAEVRDVFADVLSRFVGAAARDYRPPTAMRTVFVTATERLRGFCGPSTCYVNAAYVNRWLTELASARVPEEVRLAACGLELIMLHTHEAAHDAFRQLQQDINASTPEAMAKSLGLPHRDVPAKQLFASLKTRGYTPELGRALEEALFAGGARGRAPSYWREAFETEAAWASIVALYNAILRNDERLPWFQTKATKGEMDEELFSAIDTAEKELMLPD